MKGRGRSLRQTARWASSLLASGCATDLLPGESALPGEIPAEVLVGEPGAGFGAAVSLAGEDWIAAASNTREVTLSGEPPVAIPAGGALYPWLDRDSVGERVARVGIAGAGLFSLPDGARLSSQPDAVAFAGGDGLWVAADAAGITASDGRRWSLEDARDVAVGEGRILAMACGGGCRAWELSGAAGAESVALLGEAGPGGRVAIWRGLAWWSDPELLSERGAGRIWSEAGDAIEGLPGDFLGRTIGGGYAAGTFNALLAPPRARIVPLEGGEVLSLERGDIGRPLALAGDEVALIVGAAGWGGVEPLTGVIYLVERADLP